MGGHRKGRIVHRYRRGITGTLTLGALFEAHIYVRIERKPKILPVFIQLRWLGVISSEKPEQKMKARKTTMSGDIFLLQDNGELVELNEAPYETEALLQRFLAQYPDLLAGKQMNPEAPRKWLLISREMAVPLKRSSARRCSEQAISGTSRPFLRIWSSDKGR